MDSAQMLKIGPYQLDTPVLLAPMAGITDLPFRHAVRQFGVGMTVAEMVSSRPALQDSNKSYLRRVSLDEPLPRAIQIVGNDAEEMASAAALNEDKGAGLIDINMGCPAKKVCRKAAGSALLADENQVRAIIDAVVRAVSVPVTLKIRTGITKPQNNAQQIAHIAEQSGVQSLVVHGRSRACMFNGMAEHETLRLVKQTVSIPVIANGDIGNVEQARKILQDTGADGVMIGRAAQGQPWLPAMIGDALAGNFNCIEPDVAAQKGAVLKHIRHIHQYYGEAHGVKIARKHMRWYLQKFEGGLALAKQLNQMQSAPQILQALANFYDREIHNPQQIKLSALAA